MCSFVNLFKEKHFLKQVIIKSLQNENIFLKESQTLHREYFFPVVKQTNEKFYFKKPSKSHVSSHYPEEHVSHLTSTHVNSLIFFSCVF